MALGVIISMSGIVWRSTALRAGFASRDMWYHQDSIGEAKVMIERGRKNYYWKTVGCMNQSA
jgi:hypothetical protein